MHLLRGERERERALKTGSKITKIEDESRFEQTWKKIIFPQKSFLFICKMKIKFQSLDLGKNLILK